MLVESLGGQSDEQLLHDQQRPADSFAVFYRRHVEVVLRFVAARGADAETAADVVANTFTTALAKRDAYEAVYVTARPWLLGIAARDLADERRRGERETERRRRLQHERIALTSVDRDSYEALRDEPLDIEALLGDLPEAQRSAVVRRILNGQEYVDVARRVGRSEAATRKAVSRGLATPRAQLERSR